MDARIDSGHIGSPGRDSNDEAWILILAACFLFFFLVRAGGEHPFHTTHLFFLWGLGLVTLEKS